MKEYSEKIFNLINEIEEEIEQFEIEEIEISRINNLKKLLSATTLDELNDIRDKDLEEDKKIKQIAIKLNNYEFEQYINSKKNCEKKLEELLEKQKEIQLKTNELENKKIKQELLEYIYNLQIPIEDENIIDEIIKKYKEKNQDPIPIIKLIVEENIKYYKNPIKKEKLLSMEKIKQLNIDENDQIVINKTKELLSKEKNIQEDLNMANYLLNLQDEEQAETIEEQLEYNKIMILNAMKALLIKINNNENLEKSLELLNTIYESLNTEETELEKKDQTKLIFITKPTNKELYIYDDINKIEHKIYKRILEKQFKHLINGNISGKSLTGLPENLFEKKASQVRITYKVLPNNHILILNCYIKGNKFTQNIRELIEKPNISLQIHLYDVLATENPELIEQFLKKCNTSKEELTNYIENFAESQEINILDQFKEGEKSARKIRKSNQ